MLKTTAMIMLRFVQWQCMRTIKDDFFCLVLVYSAATNCAAMELGLKRLCNKSLVLIVFSRLGSVSRGRSNCLEFWEGI